MPTDQPNPAGPEGLAELYSLLLSAPAREDFLREVAVLAARATPATACGITVRRDEQLMTLVASDVLASQVDEVQYTQNAGPCLDAFRTGELVSVPDMAGESRWAPFPAHALSLGVRSSLSLPLAAGGENLGALNLYATGRAAFDQPAQDQAATFAAQAATAIALALAQARQAELSDQLREALPARTVIDQAIGVIMGQQRCTAGKAFAVLRQASQNSNRKLRYVATDLITAVTGSTPEPGPGFTER